MGIREGKNTKLVLIFRIDHFNSVILISNKFLHKQKMTDKKIKSTQAIFKWGYTIK